jgi:hypothetical protein
MTTLAILFAAAQTVAAPPPLSTYTCVAVQVVSPRDDRATRSRSSRDPGISATRTIDLELRVQMRPALTGDHLLRLKLLTPRGYLYQTMTIPFRFDTSPPGEGAERPPATRRVPGFPRPLPVQSLGAPSRSRPAADRVTARLPVAGTSIALGSLFGRWTAVPYLDDGAAPCGPAASFVIDQ